MKIVSIIPARGSSKSIPKKNIYPICGKPLIGWSIEQSVGCQLINQSFVTTDNDEIAACSEQFGAKIIRRPDSISGDLASSEAALLHALNAIETEYNIYSDLIVFLQATSPLRKSDDIKNCIKQIIQEQSDSIFSGSKLEDFLIWENIGEGWKSFNYDFRNRGLRQQRKPQYVENGSIYIFKPDILRKFENKLGGKISFYEMEFWQTYELDNHEDIEIVEYFLERKIKHSISKLPLDEIKLIVYDFDGVMTDNTVILDEDGKESVKVNRSDGLAISYFKKKGINQIILSTEKNKVVQKRAEKIQISYFSGVENKKTFLLDFLKSGNISPEQVLYVGNDINDLEIMLYVGYPVAPNDAHETIKKISKFVTKCNGGDGVVRELLDILMKKNCSDDLKKK